MKIYKNFHTKQNVFTASERDRQTDRQKQTQRQRQINKQNKTKTAKKQQLSQQQQQYSLGPYARGANEVKGG